MLNERAQYWKEQAEMQERRADEWARRAERAEEELADWKYCTEVWQKRYLEEKERNASQ